MSITTLLPPSPPQAAASAAKQARLNLEDIVLAFGMLGMFSVSSFGGTVHWTTWAAGQPRSLAVALAAAVAVTMTGGLVLRRINPVMMVAMVTAGGFAHLATFAAASLLMLTVPLAIYAAARWGTVRVGGIAVTLGWAGSLFAVAVWLWPVRRTDLPTYGVPAALCCAVVLISYLFGRMMRTRAAAAQAADKAAVQAYQAEMERRNQLETLSQARVRAEIARELHDVVAHSLSVMVVQAEGGQATAVRNPQVAAEALGTIARVGREAMNEMRHIVGVLREDGPAQPSTQPEALRPHPTLSEIPEMVAQAGPRVTLTVTGDPPTATPTIHVVAYRIVQESLTNFLKHAGSKATAHVRIDYLTDCIMIAVDDDGAPTPSLPQSDTPGHGIQGMRERVLSVGGTLLAGRTPTGGFMVQAWLPVPVEVGLTPALATVSPSQEAS